MTRSACAWMIAIFVAVVPLECLAQSTKNIPRIGFIFNVVPHNQMENNTGSSAFRNELARLGWTPGRNIEILWRSLEGDPARIPGTLDDLLHRDVDVIVLGSNYIAREAQKKSRTVGIVTLAAFDPVGTGLASDLRRPGANITGVIVMADTELYGKRLSLFREILPGLARMAYFSWEHPGAHDATALEIDAAFERMAQSLGIAVMRYRVARVEEMEAALADAKRKRVDGVYLDQSGIFYIPQAQAQIKVYAEKQRLPVMYSSLSGAEAGGLVAYGIREGANYEKGAQFVDRILKGAKPADLPFEQVGNNYLYVNKRAAKAIGITIPASVLMQADKVIE